MGEGVDAEGGGGMSWLVIALAVLYVASLVSFLGLFALGRRADRLAAQTMKEAKR